MTAAALTLAACAWQRIDPPRVTVVGAEPASSAGGFETRMQLKVRVQNPNDTAIEYNGISVEIDVLGKSLATGISNQTGTVPAFGEAVMTVPVTISVWSMAGQAMGLLSGKAADKITYEMRGKLSTYNSGALRFKSQGELNVAQLMSGGK